MVNDSPDRRLVGISKLAAASTKLASKSRVEYFELPTRRYITRCQSGRVPFNWTVNPYRGCEFGCKYCYARYTHEYMELREPDDFETKVFAKLWNAGAFRAELRRIDPREWIGIGTATDPYQPAERRYQVTRRMLHVFAREQSRKVSLTTKSDLIRRDIPLLAELGRRSIVRVAVSITTPDARTARLIEPYAPRPDLRMRAVAAMSDAGIRVAVLACPLLPLINDDEGSIDRLAGQAAAAGAASFTGGVVFLKPCTHGVIFPFLEQRFPHLAGRYKTYFERKAFVGEPYRDKIAARLERARRRYGLMQRFPDYEPEGWVEDIQLELPFAPPRKEPGRNLLTKSTCHKYAASL